MSGKLSENILRQAREQQEELEDAVELGEPVASSLKASLSKLVQFTGFSSFPASGDCILLEKRWRCRKPVIPSTNYGSDDEDSEAEESDGADDFDEPIVSANVPSFDGLIDLLYDFDRHCGLSSIDWLVNCLVSLIDWLIDWLIDYANKFVSLLKTVSGLRNLWKFFQNITEEEEKALEMFMVKDAPARQNLADILREKLSEKKTELDTAVSEPATLIVQKLDPAVVELYHGVRDVLKKYRSGKLPKAFKVIPKLPNWEQVISRLGFFFSPAFFSRAIFSRSSFTFVMIMFAAFQVLYITEPETWSAAAVFQATRLFASNLKERLAQRSACFFLSPISPSTQKIFLNFISTQAHEEFVRLEKKFLRIFFLRIFFWEFFSGFWWIPHSLGCFRFHWKISLPKWIGSTIWSYCRGSATTLPNLSGWTSIFTKRSGKRSSSRARSSRPSFYRCVRYPFHISLSIVKLFAEASSSLCDDMVWLWSVPFFFILQSGNCSLREAVIISGIIAKNSIPVLHSSAAILKIAEMEWCGANSVFLKILLDKKYALPYRVIDATVYHFIRYVPLVSAIPKKFNGEIKKKVIVENPAIDPKPINLDEKTFSFFPKKKKHYKARDAEWATGLERAPLVCVQLKVRLEAPLSKPVAHSASLALYVLAVFQVYERQAETSRAMAPEPAGLRATLQRGLGRGAKGRPDGSDQSPLPLLHHARHSPRIGQLQKPRRRRGNPRAHGRIVENPPPPRKKSFFQRHF